VLTLSPTGRRFRASFTVACDSACSGTAKLTVTRRLARRLRLGRSRTVGRATFRVTAAGTRAVRVTLTFKTRRAMRRAKLRRLATSLAVVATDAEAQRTSRRLTARIRRD
jgi:hypothetical protein